MIKRLIWTIWTPMSSVLKKADKLNLSLSLSFTCWEQSVPKHLIWITFEPESMKWFPITASVPRYQGSWGLHGAHLGPTGPRWAPCWPHEPCYQGCINPSTHISMTLIDLCNNSIADTLELPQFCTKPLICYVSDQDSGIRVIFFVERPPASALLTPLPLKTMAAMWQMTYWSVFSCIKILYFHSNFTEVCS